MILYSNGDSVVWGAELDDKTTERFSSILSKDMGAIDCNNASSGVSNDYIFRNTLRDIIQWIATKKIWDEINGWVESDKIKVVIGWTSPTRFEWWDGKQYQQERLWKGYDKWGLPDIDRTTEDAFVLNQTDIIPSYTKTINQVISLESFLKLNNIDYYFFNTFYHYEDVLEPNTKIDKWGRDIQQLICTNYKLEMDNMYDYLKKNNGTFHPRKHPTKESHEMWASYINKKINDSHI